LSVELIVEITGLSQQELSAISEELADDQNQAG
jgi:hypothetical protein